MAQELKAAGIEVKLDRWNIAAGQRLWDQIANFITNPCESDAWMFYATQDSLSSEPCREELAYALDRALNSRENNFPITALFPASIDRNLIPHSIAVRLFISLTDPDWKERAVAAVERRPPSIAFNPLQPFVLQPVSPPPPPFKYVLECRPRAGIWNPFIFSVPLPEKDRIGMTLRSGPPRRIPALGGVMMTRGEGITSDGRWWYSLGYEAATPTNSYYAFLREMPTEFSFGEEGNHGRVWTLGGTRLRETNTPDGTDAGPVTLRPADQ